MPGGVGTNAMPRFNHTLALNRREYTLAEKMGYNEWLAVIADAKREKNQARENLTLAERLTAALSANLKDAETRCHDAYDLDHFDWSDR